MTMLAFLVALYTGKLKTVAHSLPRRRVSIKLNFALIDHIKTRVVSQLMLVLVLLFLLLWLLLLILLLFTVV